MYLQWLYISFPVFFASQLYAFWGVNCVSFWCICLPDIFPVFFVVLLMNLFWFYFGLYLLECKTECKTDLNVEQVVFSIAKTLSTKFFWNWFQCWGMFTHRFEFISMLTFYLLYSEFDNILFFVGSDSQLIPPYANCLLLFLVILYYSVSLSRSLALSHSHSLTVTLSHSLSCFE